VIEGMTINEIVNNLSVFAIMVVIIYVGYKKYSKIENELKSERSKNMEELEKDRNLYRDEFRKTQQDMVKGINDIADAINKK